MFKLSKIIGFFYVYVSFISTELILYFKISSVLIFLSEHTIWLKKEMCVYVCVLIKLRCKNTSLRNITEKKFNNLSSVLFNDVRFLLI